MMKWAIQIVKETAESAVFIPGKGLQKKHYLVSWFSCLKKKKKNEKVNVCKNDTDSTKPVRQYTSINSGSNELLVYHQILN